MGRINHRIMAFFLLLFLYLSHRCTALNYTKCPGPLEIQTTDIMDTFDITKFTGIYYEIAFHDYTQIVCPSRSCVTSNKTYAFNTNMNAIEDHFELDCFGKPDDSLFVYNVTSIPAFCRSCIQPNIQWIIFSKHNCCKSR